MVSKNKIFLLALIFMMLFSCSSSKKIAYGKYSVYITNSSKFSLLPLSAAETKIDSFQKIEGRFGKKNFSFDAYVISDEKKLYVSILNSFGVNAGELLYTEESLEFTSSVFPKSVKAEYAVADFQLCFYDPDIVKSELKIAGLDLIITKTEDVEIRKIVDEKKCIIEITKRKNEIVFQNHLRGYQYKIFGETM